MSDPAIPMNDPVAPVSEATLATEAREPVGGVGICLSGGGFRAMLFHTGTLWRLHDSGWLAKATRISSVSGGSIVSALLGLKWSRIAGHSTQAFVDEVVAPVRALARETIDFAAVGGGLLSPFMSISEMVSKAYAKHLYGKATLQDLPDDPPRFVINATNVQSSALWRFSKPYMGDYLVGRVDKPKTRIADAVAASSAFPPFLSPAKLEDDNWSWLPPEGELLHRPPFTTDVVLSDGGVYDNLGLETAWKRCKTLLVSDAGASVPPEEGPSTLWPQHAVRVLNVIDNQVRSLRKRQLIAAFNAKSRNGGFWSIRGNIASYEVPALPCPFERTQQLAAVPTRLGEVDEVLQERLINWGYALTDAGLRKWVDPGVAAAAGFPYPASAV